MELGFPWASPQPGLRTAGAGEEGRNLVLCVRNLGASSVWGMARLVVCSLLAACSYPLGCFSGICPCLSLMSPGAGEAEEGLKGE